MLLRVGIDTGTDGALAPIFDDGSFEYIPLSEQDKGTNEIRTYQNTIGRSGVSLSSYLPEKIHDRRIHFDPEFETFTYGDPTVKRKYLVKLFKDDLLVFYAGLKPYRTDKYDNALYIIGYFTVDRIFDFNTLCDDKIDETELNCKNNAHIKRCQSYADLVIVTGIPDKSKLLEKAIRISNIASGRNGVIYHAVSSETESLLGISGSIQRSIPPRFIIKNKCIENLKEMIGY